MTNFKNFTPHAIKLNDGTVFESEGLARVSTTFTEIVDGIAHQVFGEVTGLPEPEEGTMLIVSALVLGASTREDLVAPATGHKDTIRNDKGHIVSVPCFTKIKRS